ncbi:ATP-binding protein [Streptomyces sp. NPDC050625]|uniref:ATP-binding protein n=1 Tax=Streptomyces sp. NPDC050625 TaxID=3154629 RepID=UPI00343E7FC2
MALTAAEAITPIAPTTASEGGGLSTLPALLIVSELVTNAVVHAQPPVRLSLLLRVDHTLLIEVTDGGPGAVEE